MKLRFLPIAFSIVALSTPTTDAASATSPAPTTETVSPPQVTTAPSEPPKDPISPTRQSKSTAVASTQAERSDPSTWYGNSAIQGDITVRAAFEVLF
jgi:hypothetical protein